MNDPMPHPAAKASPVAPPVALEADIPEGRALVVADARGPVLLYRWRGKVCAFRNVCPHVGTPLDMMPGRVFTHDGQQLICATHGALFDPGTGACVYGPCKGKALEAVPIRLANGQVWLEGTD